MLTIGLDVHEKFTTLCALDEKGEIRSERKIYDGFGGIAEALGQVGEEFRVCFEASCGYGTLHDMLKPLAKEVVVAHPGELRLIFRSMHKNDRVDAHKLARLLRLDAVPAVHVPEAQMRAFRGAVEHRTTLVQKRTRAKIQVRFSFKTHGIKAPVRWVLWGPTGRLWLKEQKLPNELDQMRLQTLIAEVDLYDAQIAYVEAKLDKLAAQDWRIKLLRTIPGVGPRTAEAVVAYIDVPERFGHIKAIGRYFGIVPRQDSSGGRERLGSITKAGPATVRKLVVEAAWQMIRKSPRMKAFFERVMGGQKQRKKVALVAVAHKLLRIMLAMLKHREEWRKEEVVVKEKKVKKAKAAA
jgi:transposase